MAKPAQVCVSLPLSLPSPPYSRALGGPLTPGMWPGRIEQPSQSDRTRDDRGVAPAGEVAFSGPRARPRHHIRCFCSSTHVRPSLFSLFPSSPLYRFLARQTRRHFEVLEAHRPPRQPTPPLPVLGSADYSRFLLFAGDANSAESATCTNPDSFVSSPNNFQRVHVRKGKTSVLRRSIKSGSRKIA